MKLKAIIVVCLLSLSCKKDVDYKNQEKLCQLVLDIYKDDQKYRGLMEDPFFKILDSIKISEGIKEDYRNFSEKKQLAYGKVARTIANKRKNKFTKIQEDSLMQLQISLDNKNTELLIDIIK